MSLFTRSWLTLLIGAAGAVAVEIANALQAAPSPALHVVAGALLFLGAFSKAFNVSGGKGSGPSLAEVEEIIARALAAAALGLPEAGVALPLRMKAEIIPAPASLSRVLPSESAPAPAPSTSGVNIPRSAAIFALLFLGASLACATAAGVQGAVPFDAGGGVHGAVVIGPEVNCLKHVTITSSLPNGGTDITDAVIHIHGTANCP